MTTGRSRHGEASLEERLKEVQRRLGVEDDGIVGPETLTRLEARLGIGEVRAAGAAAYSLEVSRRGLDEIVFFEVTSPAHYERKLSRPTWPGGASGVTIGIGYDLGYNTKAAIRKDWGGRIPDVDLNELLGAAGVKGEAAAGLAGSLSHIKIPLRAAQEVHYTVTLPRYARQTRQAYPGVEALPADAQAMLLSLVFNRGTKMEGERRREMKAIRPLVQAGDLKGIARQIRAMKRLWDIHELPGLHKRRDREAELIETARTTYPPEELVRV